jgi:hypothetical protein
VKKETQIMSKSKIVLTLLAVTFAAPLGLADKASAAQKKVTYEQAWKICLDELNKENVYGTGIQANDRYVRIEGCMMRYGYRA